jgi:heptosyltransferase-1
VETAAPHVVDRGCELLGAAIGEELRAAAVPLPVDEAAERWCDALLEGLGVSGRFALLAPTAGWGAKQWPVERYGAVAAALAEAGCVPLVNAAKENDGVAAAVPVVCSMAELVALMRRVSLMVAGDTGPLHLAAALGRPVVGLYGPTDPGRTGPYGGPHCARSEVIRHESSSVDHRRHSEPEFGLAQITVEEVVEAGLRMLEAEA